MLKDLIEIEKNWEQLSSGEQSEIRVTINFIKFHFGTKFQFLSPSLKKTMHRQTQLVNLIATSKEKLLKPIHEKSIHELSLLCRCAKSVKQNTLELQIDGLELECPPYMTSEEHSYPLGS